MADKQAEIDQAEADLKQARADLEAERIEAAKIEAQAKASPAAASEPAPTSPEPAPVQRENLRCFDTYCAPAEAASAPAPDVAAILERILATMDRAGCSVCAARMVIKQELAKARKALDREAA